MTIARGGGKQSRDVKLFMLGNSASDHSQNTIMLNHYSYLWKNVRDAFNNGYLRFDDMKAKSAIFDILSVDLYK